MQPMRVKQIKRLVDGVSPSLPFAPLQRRASDEAVVALTLKYNLGFKWAAVAVAMADGDIGSDGWFQVLWNGVTVRFPVHS